MANKIQIRRGLKQDLPLLSIGEPALTLDTKEVYIGDGTENIELAKKDYVDSQILAVSTNGVSKLASYDYDLYATIDNQTVFEIPYELFETNTDTLMVFFDGMKRPKSDYVVTDPVNVGGVITKGYITLTIGRPIDSYVGLQIFKNILNDANGVFSGSLISDDSVSQSKIIGLEDTLNDFENLIGAIPTQYKSIASINSLYDENTPIEEIITSMSDFSVLITQTATLVVDGTYPTMGTLTITKININRVMLEFVSISGYEWTASYHDGTGFTGWKQVAYKNDVLVNTEKIAKLSNPNLFVNGDFKIWQRANSFNNIASNLKYTADRWVFGGNDTSTVQKTWSSSSNNSMFYVNNNFSNLWSRLFQRMENITFINGNIFTLTVNGSFPIGSLIKSYIQYTKNGVTSETVALGGRITATSESWTNYVFTFTMPSFDAGTFPSVGVQASSPAGISPFNFTLNYMKLEAGDMATPFIAKKYSEELNECQRFYQKMDVGSIYTYLIAGGSSYKGRVCFPTSMRITPTIINAGYGYSSIAVIEDVSPNGFTFVNNTSASDCILKLYTADSEIY